jgi:hypothetical protein
VWDPSKIWCDLVLRRVKRTQAVYDRRLMALQEEHQQLERELAQLEYGNGADGETPPTDDDEEDSVITKVSGRDLRQLDDAIADADVELTAWKYGFSCVCMRSMASWVGAEAVCFAWLIREKYKFMSSILDSAKTGALHLAHCLGFSSTDVFDRLKVGALASQFLSRFPIGFIRVSLSLLRFRR